MGKKLSYCLALTTLLAGTVAVSAAEKFSETVKGVSMRHMGPGNGGSMFGVNFKSDDPKVIIFGGDMGATYRTADGGKKWTVIGGKVGHQPKSAFVIKFHPKQRNIVWHGGGHGFYKSIDSGKSWVRMQLPISSCGAIGLDPDDSNIVYVSEGMAPRMNLNWVRGRVYKTVDGGKSWQKLARPGGALNVDKEKLRNYTNLIVDPTSKIIKGEGHARVYIFGRGGLYRSDDAGKSWQDLSGSFAPGQITDMCLVNKQGRALLFLAAAAAPGFKTYGVYKSSNNGQSWQAMNNGLEKILDMQKKHNAQKGLAKNRNADIFSLMLAHSPQNIDRLYVGSHQGIARSDDLGKTWHEVLSGRGSYVKDKNGKYVAVLKSTKKITKSLYGGIDHFNRLVVAQSNADIVAFDDNQGLYVSVNSGKTWEDVTFDYGKEFNHNALSTKGLPPNRFTHRTQSRGVQNIVSDQIVMDPFDPQTYYAAYMDLGLEISRDGGEYWEHPTIGIPSRGHAWAVAVDPVKKGRVFVTIGQKWGQPGGIYRSDNGGKNWQRIGLKDASMGVIHDIELDLNSPVNSRTIYLATGKKGVYKSTNGGKSWVNLSGGLNKDAQNALTVKLTKDSKKLYAGTNAGLMVSTNGGKSWKLIKQKLFERVKVLAISKSNPDYIYVTANLPKNNFYWGKAHFFKSNDGGKNWQDITPNYIVYAGAIAVNPYDPNYLYACTNLTSGNNEKLVIIRSKDGGKSWQDIGNGISFNRGVNITIDDNNPQHLFVHARFGLIEIMDSQAPKK